MLACWLCARPVRISPNRPEPVDWKQPACNTAFAFLSAGRKVIRTRGKVPTDEAALTRLVLAIRHRGVCWTSARGWTEALAPFNARLEAGRPWTGKTAGSTRIVLGVGQRRSGGRAVGRVVGMAVGGMRRRSISRGSNFSRPPA